MEFYPGFVSRSIELMKDNAENTMGDTEIPKQDTGQKLSKDRKWRSFPKIPNLLQYVSTGTYFARIKVNGKIIRLSLERT